MIAWIIRRHAQRRSSQGSDCLKDATELGFRRVSERFDRMDERFDRIEMRA